MAKTCHPRQPNVFEIVECKLHELEDEIDGIDDWDDGVGDTAGVGYLRENWMIWDISRAAHKRMCVAASCCIRAGIDVASKPSGGVLGYTVGHIRRMYPEGIPDWLRAVFDEMRGPNGEHLAFEQWPAKAGLWL